MYLTHFESTSSTFSLSVLWYNYCAYKKHSRRTAIISMACVALAQKRDGVLTANSCTDTSFLSLQTHVLSVCRPQRPGTYQLTTRFPSSGGSLSPFHYLPVHSTQSSFLIKSDLNINSIFFKSYVHYNTMFNQAITIRQWSSTVLTATSHIVRNISLCCSKQPFLAITIKRNWSWLHCSYDRR